MTTTTGSRTDHPTRGIPQILDSEQAPHWRHGRVAWFNAEKGFGFLTPDTGPAVFVDYRAIEVPGFKTLLAGQQVLFTCTDTPRGPEATRVVPGARAHTTPRPAVRPHRRCCRSL